jgi:TetR/AcrR family transcriptional repressor of acrEF/envCD operon
MARKTKEEALRTRQLLIESAIQQFALRGDQHDPDGYR